MDDSLAAVPAGCCGRPADNNRWRSASLGEAGYAGVASFGPVGGFELTFRQGHNVAMPNIASVLKAEITRLARKELREESEGLKRAVVLQRKEIATLKARLQAVEKIVQRLGRATKAPRAEPRAAVPNVTGESDTAEGLRFRAAGMASNRKRLGLSATDFALLVGTTGQSVYAWEAGKSKPRAEALKAIASLRHIGKRDVEARLAELKG